MPKINITISDSMMRNVATLRKQLDINSDAELFREALRVLRFLAGAIESGDDTNEITSAMRISRPVDRKKSHRESAHKICQ